MKRWMLSISVCLVLVALATEVYADQKVKKRMSFGQQSFDTTTYIKGQRSRDEMNFGQFQMVTIHQCDLGQDVSVNDGTKTYMVTKTGRKVPNPAAGAKGAAAQDFEEEQETPAGARKGGVVTINTSVQDTGERKDFFGYQARHLKTSMSMKSSPDACEPNKATTMATDGWYINFREKFQSCERPMTGDNSPMRRSEPTCVDRHRYTGSGVMSMFNQGFGVDVTTTVTDDSGKQTSFRQQALDISSATLDPGLFDAPAGYREAKNYSEMMGFGGMGSTMGGRARRAAGSREPAPTPEVREASMTPEVKGRTRVRRRMVGTREIGPKAPGKIRVGVVAFDDKSGKMTDADTLRQTLMDGIEHFGYETVPIDSRSQSAAMNDAKELECDYIVFNSMTPKVSGAQAAKKIGGFMGRMAGGMTGVAADRATSDSNAFQGTVDFQLFKVVASDPSLTGTNEAQGGNGGKGAMDKEARDVAKQIAKGK